MTSAALLEKGRRLRGRRVAWSVVASSLLLVSAFGVARAQMAPPIAAQVGADRRAQADAMLTRMEGSAANIRRELESARATRDVVKALCLNDKLSQIDVAIRSARDRRMALEQASLRQDAEQANHEFTILDVLRQRVEQLTREASQCIGVDAYFIGESVVSVAVDPSIPEPDTATIPGGQLMSAPPICASCVR